MKRIRLVSVLLSWACFVCLCSIGFSSWYQFDPVNAEASGSFVGYGTVVNMDECVYAEAGSFTVFDYSSLSFVESTSMGFAEEDVGEIHVTYVVNVAKTKAAMEAEGKSWTGSLNVKIDLSYENLADYGEGANFKGLFLLRADAHEGSKKEIGVAIGGSAPNGGMTISDAGDRVSLTHAVTGLSGTETLELEVVYSFDVPKSYSGGTVGNFRSNFGKYLKTDLASGGATQFITTAWIVELRGE